MNWRPKQEVCVKAIGLPFRNNSLLAAEVLNDAGKCTGVRPLGGHVEFGENWRTTIVREFKEELNVNVSVESDEVVLENIYQHERHTGHEIVFAARVDLSPHDLVGDAFNFAEDNGLICTARWFEIETLDETDGPKLFPTGLKQRLGELRS